MSGHNAPDDAGRLESALDRGHAVPRSPRQTAYDFFGYGQLALLGDGLRA